MKKDWNTVYSTAATPGEPAEVLLDNLHLLPTTGCALDAACGLGANALLLAQHGLQVDAWDASQVAVAKLNSFAVQRDLSVNAVVGNVSELVASRLSWDVIVISHFLDRNFCTQLPALLRPGGLVFYQTFTLACANDGGPRNPDYLLADNELLQLFAGLQIRYFRDEGSTGNRLKGHRGKSFLVAQKANA